MNYINYENYKKTNILTNKEQKIYNILIKKITTWLIQKVSSAHANGISLGISGGIDSATLAIISSNIFRDNAFFYYFKIDENKKVESYVKKLEKRLYSKIKIVDLSDTYLRLKSTLKINNKIVLANLKSRLFMSSLYALSQKNNTLVLGTDNYAEYYLGYFTKYGDGGCDLLPFANIDKSDVYILANILNVPKEIIKRKPSADLYKNQSDEKDLGFSYDEFEKWKYDAHLVDEKISERIQTLQKITEHKRELIPKGPKLK